MPSFVFKEELGRENYFWILYQTDRGLWLDVLCGRSAVFSISFLLTEEESQQYAVRGEEAIREIAYRVQDSPATFRARNAD